MQTRDLVYQEVRWLSSRDSLFNVIHILCSRLIIQYLIQQTVQSITNNHHLHASYMFQPVPGRHQGGLWKGIQQILSDVHV